MHFYKLSALGQDYIFSDDKCAFDNISESDIKHICDRIVGVGATGIFTLNQKEAKKAQIRAFCQNGEIMRDLSTASICAALGLKITTGIQESEILSENNRFFTCLSPLGDNSFLVSCDISKSLTRACGDKIERKTELGNRILTLTPVFTSGSFAIHFSECMESLNFKYLAEKTEEVTVFGRNTSLILAEKTNINSYILSRMLEDEQYIIPYAGAFAGAALAACKTGRSNYSEEIKLTCGEYEAYAVCKEDKSVTLHTVAEIVYEGNI